MTDLRPTVPGVRTIWTPKDFRPIKTWAGDKVTLPAVITKRGKFTTDSSRHFEAPIICYQADRVRALFIVAPVRGGKTLIADVCIPHSIVNEAASVLWVFDTDVAAKQHAEQRQMPILRSVPEILAMLSTDRHKTRTTDILFASGLPFRMCGPAIGNLQAKGYKIVVCDEAWLYDAGKLGEAEARLGDWLKIDASKFLVMSQGGPEEGDWAIRFAEATPFVWRPKCEACAQPMPIEWTITKPDGTTAGATWDTIAKSDGTYDKAAMARSIRYRCPHCGHDHPNSAKTRAAWNLSGEYFNADTGEQFDPANPPREASFRWHGLIDYPWEILLGKWLAAITAKKAGNFKPLVEFFQKYCALMRSERTVHDSDLPFRRMAMHQTDPTAKAWEGEHTRALTVDRQGEDVYWAVIRAWSKTGESRRLWFGKLFSPAAVEAKRVEFGIANDCTLIDSGYLPKGDTGVYAMCIRYGWVAVKGEDDAFFWHSEPQAEGAPPLRVQKAWAPTTWGDPGDGTTEQGKQYAPLIRYSSPTLTDRVMGLIEAGLWVEPDTEPDATEREYRIQMSAEFKRPKINKFTGKREMVWVCPSGNNHALDVSKEQVLFALHAGCLPDDAGMTGKPMEPAA